MKKEAIDDGYKNKEKNSNFYFDFFFNNEYACFVNECCY